MHKQLSSVIAPTCPPCTGGRKVLDSFTLASAARDGGGEVMRSWFYSSQGAVLRLTDEVNSVCVCRSLPRPVSRVIGERSLSGQHHECAIHRARRDVGEFPQRDGIGHDDDVRARTLWRQAVPQAKTPARNVAPTLPSILRLPISTKEFHRGFETVVVGKGKRDSPRPCNIRDEHHRP